MPSVLMIAYYFPPSPAVGALRTHRFARYLPRYGWRPVVLSVRRDTISAGATAVFQPDLPAEVEVHRTPALNTRGFYQQLSRLTGSRPAASPSAAPAPAATEAPAPTRWLKTAKAAVRCLFEMPDWAVGWFPFAVAEGLRQVRRHRPTVIYTSGSPWTDHLIGLVLSRLTRLPWVADFRDPWVSNSWAARPLPLFSRVDARLEAAIVRRASRVIANTEPARQDFAARYGPEHAGKIVAIPNGFDPEELPAAAPKEDPAHLVLLHTGTLYAQSDPTGLFTALRELTEEHPEWRPRLRLVQVGDVLPMQTGPISQLLADTGCEELVELRPSVSRSECLRLQRSADVLVLIRPRTRLQTPAKLYEYLASGRPILALVHEGATADIIREAEAGLVAAPEEVAGIKAALRTLVTAAAADRWHVSADKVARYAEPHLTGCLVDEFVAAMGREVAHE